MKFIFYIFSIFYYFLPMWNGPIQFFKDVTFNKFVMILRGKHAGHKPQGNKSKIRNLKEKKQSEILH